MLESLRSVSEVSGEIDFKNNFLLLMTQRGLKILITKTLL